MARSLPSPPNLVTCRLVSLSNSPRQTPQTCAQLVPLGPGLVGPVRAVRGWRAERNRKTMGDGHWAHLRMSSDSTQRPPALSPVIYVPGGF